MVCYDIVSDERRRDVARILEDYGTRVQYSVFACSLGESLRDRLVEQLSKALDPVEDSIMFFRLCRGCERQVAHLGRDPPEPDPQLIIL